MSVSTKSSLHQESDRSVTEQVLSAIATREGSDPLDFDRPLYDVIDPDALDALFQSNSRSGQLSFTYLGYEVTVHGDQEIALDSIDE